MSIKVDAKNLDPCVVWDGGKVSLVCEYRKGVDRFFYDLVTKWLVPDKELEVCRFSVEKEDGILRACITLELEGAQDIAWARHNAPFLEKEILLGASSLYHAKRILELRGLSSNEKIALVQDRIGALVRRFPGYFDYDIFPEMHHLFLSAGEEFKAVRGARELGRIVSVLYHFRKELEEAVAKSPGRRHIYIKCKKTILQSPFGPKEVFSIFVCLNFIKEHELFEERHFLAALPEKMQCVPDSYFACDGDGMQRFYVEVAGNGDPKGLEAFLRKEIGTRIKQLVPPVFMPRNEEEVMRNVLTLSNQLKFLRDIPQMMISFDEQTEDKFFFTVVLVRLLLPESLKIDEVLKGSNLSIDRVKIVGQIRRKYPKEAVVLRAKVPTSPFLREDYSVDFLKVRKKLLKEVEQVFGPVRDYNGGMIAKQRENFVALRTLLGKEGEPHPLLLQNFFHAIFPAHKSATLAPKHLKILFEMLLKVIEKGKMQERVEDGMQFMVGKGERDLSISTHLLSFQLQVQDTPFFGLILTNHIAVLP